MHAAVEFDWLLKFTASAAAETASAMVAGFLDFVRSTSSIVLSAASNIGLIGFSPDCCHGEMMEAAAAGGEHKVSDCCGFVTARRFAGGEMVEHRSAGCQSSHWNSERGTECARTKSPYAVTGRKVSLLSAVGSSDIHGKSNEILFPYEKFIELFNWEKPGYPPCGLKNDGNSCFANVVLQCLTYTRPLAAYFLEKGHKLQCRMDKWCFLCDFQTHVERASWSHTAFTPINILLRLNNLGGNFERGQQEDAHEFMRFAIDKMQSVFLDEIGGEKTAHPRYQETSFVQHIFGGCLQSQVVCSKCKNVSNRFDHMMDLTVEIHGDAESLEECLDRFTAEEWLHGDNMYKCDCCNDYVVARKCLAVRQAPNILTIALKRFQSGGLNKLNKRVTFPEELDLRLYMNELEDGNDVYKLYAVIVHVDIDHTLGHYICYVKDFGGNWYRIDDDKVSTVGLDEVLSQGAYMLLYSRIRARPSCLLPAASLREQENQKMEVQTVDPSTTQPVNSADISTARHSVVGASGRAELSSVKHAEDAGDDVEMAPCDACLPKEEDFPLKLDFFKSPSVCDVESAGPCYTRETNGRYNIPSFTTGEVQNEKSANCTYMHGTAKCEGNGSISPQNGSGAIPDPVSAPGSLCRQRMQKFIERENNDSEAYIFGPCDDDTREAAGASAATSVGLCPEVKFKPLSSLGGKRRKELFKQEDGSSVGFGGKTPRINIYPLYISENGRCLKSE